MNNNDWRRASCAGLRELQKTLAITKVIKKNATKKGRVAKIIVNHFMTFIQI